MDSGLWWLVVGGAVVLVATVLVTVATVVSASRERRRLADDLAAARDELAAVQRRVEGLARRSPAAASPQEFVITTAGTVEGPAEVEPAAPVPHQQLTARQFASVALGESMVTLASFGHGVRRALSPENRNRIAFEMRREVRRARKRRRRDLKEARRHLRAQSFDEDAA
jgi:hypothetical protein